jgi:carboxylate-amine ligase
MSAPNRPSFTFGIEEEYHLVDRATGLLAEAPAGLIEACRARVGDHVSPEFLKTQIEIGTPVCRSFAEARDHLNRLRHAIGLVGAEHGLAPLAAGTHPFARPGEAQPTERARYQALAQDLAGIGRRLSICGMHVHVGVEDYDLRIDLMNQMRYFLPHLLALSTSSPFWDGEDTGLKSYRLSIVDNLPRTGLPGRFSGWGEYSRTIDVLVRGGVIEDASKVWWDIRPSTRFPTLEMRITDVCTRVDDAVAIAALYVSLVHMLWRLRRANQTWRTYPVFLLEENRWRAQRYGTAGGLFDFGKGALVPFRDLIDELVLLVAEDADALGCRTEVEAARRILRDGTSADRQTAAYAARLAQGDGREDALRAVVRGLVAETLSETP